MRKYFFCFLVVLLSRGLVSAQQHRIDSLLNCLAKQKEDTLKANTLNNLCIAYHNLKNEEKIEIYAQQLMDLSQKLGFQKGIAQSYFNMGVAKESKSTPAVLANYLKALDIFEKIGWKAGVERTCGHIGLYYNGKSDYAHAIEYEGRALSLAQEIGNKNFVAVNATNLGNEYRDEGDYPKALENYLLSLRMDDDMHDSSGIELDYNSLNSVYVMTKDNAKAMEYAKKALRIAQKLQDTVEIGSCIGNIGLVYENMNALDSSLFYELQAVKYFKLINYTFGLYTIEGDLGSVYQEKNDYDNALKFYNDALNLAKAAEDKVCIVRNLGNIGDVYKRKKEYAQAENLLLQALEIADSIHYTEASKDFYVDLSEAYKATGQWQKAYEAFFKATIANDSLVSTAKNQQMGKLEAKAEYDKKLAIQQAEQDNKAGLAAAESKRQNVVIIFSVAIALIIAIIAVVILRSLRVTQKQKKLIDNQKALVEEKNKEITDSITYAKRLQDAILPSITELKKYLPESFVLYKPKDIVAGDFYWMWKAGEELLIAACDCTGHGVPGAMVSVVCSNALNRAVKEFKIIEPGKILDKVRELVIETFEKSENDVKDGMDISLASLSLSKGGIELKWAGAYNSLWYVHDGQINEIAGDKQPIGKMDNPKPFTTHTIKLNPPLEGRKACIYLFTDGYADQFGGTKGKKYKYRQLSEKLLAISHQPLAKQSEILDKEFEDWKGNLEQTDDVCMIGIRL